MCVSSAEERCMRRRALSDVFVSRGRAMCVSFGAERCVCRGGAPRSVRRRAQSDGSAVRRAMCAPSARSDVCVERCTVTFPSGSENLMCVSGCTVFFGSTVRCVFR